MGFFDDGDFSFWAKSKISRDTRSRYGNRLLKTSKIPNTGDGD